MLMLLVYMIEAIVKMVALGPLYYFQNKWNVWVKYNAWLIYLTKLWKEDLKNTLRCEW